MPARKTKKSKPKYLKNPTNQLIAAIALFTLTAMLVRDGGMADWEKSLFHAIYGLPNWLTPLFYVVTQLGSIFVLILLASLYLVKQHYHIVIRLLMSGLLAYLLAGVAKDLFGRARPQELLIDIIYRDYLIRGPGFPSGHMALATAVALTLGRYVPRRWRWLVPVMIVAVGLSRVYLGVHAPLDIIGGFAIGWGSAAIFRKVRLTDLRKNPKTT